MKELLIHLWTNSRVFQITVIVGVLAIGWNLLGRPTGRTPPVTPAPDQTAKIETPAGTIQVPGVTNKDAADLKNKGKDVMGNAAEAANATSGAIKSMADAAKDAADATRKGVKKVSEAVLGSPGQPPLDPPSPPTKNP